VTQEQQALLEEATVAHARAMVDLKATVDKAEIDLRVAADRDPLDKAKVRAAFAAMQQARTRLEAERFEMLLRVREVLTREQWEKLKVLTRERIAAEAGEEAPPLPGRPPRGRRF
jgi:Spy/CpxP family protein refolding chaperone